MISGTGSKLQVVTKMNLNVFEKLDSSHVMITVTVTRLNASCKDHGTQDFTFKSPVRVEGK